MKINKQRSLFELAKIQGYLESKVQRPGYRQVTELNLHEVTVEIFRMMKDGHKWGAQCDADFDAGAAINAQFEVVR